MDLTEAEDIKKRWQEYTEAAAAAAKSLQSCPNLWDPIDGSPPGSPVPVILQARTLEWVAISFSNPWKWKVKGKLLSSVQLLVAPWTAVYQDPPPMGFSRQEYWSGVPLPTPRYQFSRPKVIPISTPALPHQGSANACAKYTVSITTTHQPLAARSSQGQQEMMGLAAFHSNFIYGTDIWISHNSHCH